VNNYKIKTTTGFQFWRLTEKDSFNESRPAIFENPALKLMTKLILGQLSLLCLLPFSALRHKGLAYAPPERQLSKFSMLQVSG